MTLDELNDQISALEARILRSTTASQQLKDLHGRAESLRGQIQALELEGTVDPTAGWRAAIAESKDAIAGLGRTMDMLTNEVLKLQGELPLAEFWEKAFGSRGIRNMLIDDIRALLTYHSNLYLGRIAGDQLQMEFPQDSDRFEIQVAGAGGVRAIETYCTGEAERLNLACILALRDALMYRQKTPLRFLLLDDPLAHIDDAGVAGLVSMVMGLGELGRTDQVLVTVPTQLEGVPTLWVEKKDGKSTVHMEES